MKEIWTELTETHDDHAQINGFLEQETLIFYDENDKYLPSTEKIKPETPCLIHEVFDYELSTKTKIPIMKVKNYIKLTKKQAQFFKKIKKIKTERVKI
jgi:hypothetical protein